MSKNVVPMIHVPDVRATVDWYQSVGFQTVNTYDNGTPDGLSFAINVVWRWAGNVQPGWRDQ
jgi:hypothetical protein